MKLLIFQKRYRKKMIKIQSKRLAHFFLRHPIHTYYTDMYQQVHRQSNGASTYDQATAQRTENWLQRPQQKQSICSAKNKISYPPNLPPPPCPSSCHSAPALTLMNFIKIFYVYEKKFTKSFFSNQTLVYSGLATSFLMLFEVPTTAGPILSY